MTGIIANEFKLEPGLLHFNHAGIAPWPQRTVQAVCDFAWCNATRGSLDSRARDDTAQRLRGLLRRLINAESDGEIAFVKNTSEGLSIVAYGHDWCKGGNVVFGQQEFPSNRLAWESLAPRFGVEARRVDLCGALSPEQALLDRLDRNTQMLAVSSIQYATGYRMDLEQLGRACRDVGALFCVDAIQSLGAAPIDVQACHVDFLAADGHKWMLAPEGIGLLYCRSDRLQDLKLHQYGWAMMQHRGDYDTLYNMAEAPGCDLISSSARRLECGSLNHLGIYALHASLELLFEAGLANVFEQVSANVSRLAQSLPPERFRMLTPDDTSKRGGILTFALRDGDTRALYQRLQDAGVLCACRAGGLRLSPHFYTPQAHLDRVINLLAP